MYTIHNLPLMVSHTFFYETTLGKFVNVPSFSECIYDSGGYETHLCFKLTVVVINYQYLGHLHDQHKYSVSLKATHWRPYLTCPP